MDNLASFKFCLPTILFVVNKVQNNVSAFFIFICIIRNYICMVSNAVIRPEAVYKVFFYFSGSAHEEWNSYSPKWSDNVITQPEYKPIPLHGNNELELINLYHF